MSLEIVLPRSPLADLIRETAVSWPPRGRDGEEVVKVGAKIGALAIGILGNYPYIDLYDALSGPMRIPCIGLNFSVYTLFSAQGWVVVAEDLLSKEKRVLSTIARQYNRCRDIAIKVGLIGVAGVSSLPFSMYLVSQKTPAPFVLACFVSDTSPTAWSLIATGKKIHECIGRSVRREVEEKLEQFRNNLADGLSRNIGILEEVSGIDATTLSQRIAAYSRPDATDRIEMIEGDETAEDFISLVTTPFREGEAEEVIISPWKRYSVGAISSILTLARLVTLYEMTKEGFEPFIGEEGAEALGVAASLANGQVTYELIEQALWNTFERIYALLSCKGDETYLGKLYPRLSSAIQLMDILLVSLTPFPNMKLVDMYFEKGAFHTLVGVTSSTGLMLCCLSAVNMLLRSALEGYGKAYGSDEERLLLRARDQLQYIRTLIQEADTSHLGKLLAILPQEKRGQILQQLALTEEEIEHYTSDPAD